MDRDRPDLNVFPLPIIHLQPQVEKHVVEFLVAIDQGIAMIGKGKRYKAPTCQPALDIAEDNAIGQRIPGGQVVTVTGR
jgi:hypothetical protein